MSKKVLEVEDAVEYAIVPKNQIKKIDASVKIVKHGKVGADSSKVKTSNFEDLCDSPENHSG